MKIGRVALIYDDRPRPETTGVYCRRALESLVEVVHFRPDELSAIPTQGFDLYLNIDDGLRYHLPAALHPCACWVIDTHMDFGWCLEKARGFDLVFAAQRDGTEQLRGAGIDSAAWLPLACDPEIHCKHDVLKAYDVAFVGNVFPGPRADLLNLVRRRYPLAFIGNAYFEEMARAYSAARTAFNRSIKNDVNMRVFEALACGSLLVTNDLAANGQAELFRDGVHLATYREPEELLDKLAFYLEREEVRERIAAGGRAEAIEKHTYRHRMERLLSEAEAALARAVVGRGSLRVTEGGDFRSETKARPGNHGGEHSLRVSAPREGGKPSNEESAQSCWSTAFRRTQTIRRPPEGGTPTRGSHGFRGRCSPAKWSSEWVADHCGEHRHRMSGPPEGGTPTKIPPVPVGVPPSGGIRTGSADRLKAGLQPEDPAVSLGVAARHDVPRIGSGDPRCRC